MADTYNTTDTDNDDDDNNRVSTLLVNWCADTKIENEFEMKIFLHRKKKPRKKLY